MSIPPEKSRKEYPNTYFVQDRSNEEELQRLALQDRMLTAAVGGTLPEQPEVAALHRILDIGCGTGGWVIQAAKEYPTIDLLIGVDVSLRYVNYARRQIENDAALAQRVEFTSMDALRMLEFRDGFFDLVNERFNAGYLRTWDWHKFLKECIRITSHGGVLRFTECSLPECTSAAYKQLSALLLQALDQAGHTFTNDTRSTINELPRLFARHSIQNVQMRERVLRFQPGTEQYTLFAQDLAHVYRTVLPFLKKWTHVPDDYEQIYQQMLDDLRRPDGEGSWTLLTIWGNTPG